MNTRFLFDAGRIILKQFIKRPRIKYAPGIPRKGVLFVANHESIWGPILTILYSQTKLLPWVIADIMTRIDCRIYLEKDFCRRVLRLKSPFSKHLAILLETVCIAIMNYVGAIPVHRQRRGILQTIDETVRLLDAGNNIIVYPDMTMKKSDYNHGFFKVAFSYSEIRRLPLPIVPVAVNKTMNMLLFGEPLNVAATRSYKGESERIKNEIWERIRIMYQTGEPYSSIRVAGRNRKLADAG